MYLDSTPFLFIVSCMSLCACMHVCMHICTHACYMNVFMCCKPSCMHDLHDLYVCTRMYIYMYIYVCRYLCGWLCFVHENVCAYACIPVSVHFAIHSKSGICGAFKRTCLNIHIIACIYTCIYIYVCI